MDAVRRMKRKIAGTVDLVRAFLSGSEKVENIEVYGRPEFRRAVTAALAVLRDRRMPAWDTISQHVSSIFEGRRTTIFVPSHPAFMLIDGAHAAQALDLLAATISHMACSCQIHRNYEREFPGRPVPRDIYSGDFALEQCDQAYQECLRVLGNGVKG